MHSLSFTARGIDDTERLGKTLAGVLPETLTVPLIGPLGAGKTRLVQAVAAACGIDRRDVTSPTFVICQHHFGSRILYHLDAYRVGDVGEFLDLGVDEYFAGPGITFIEWGDRVAEALPADRLTIQLHIIDADRRSFELLAQGPVAQQTLERLRAALG